MADWFKFYNDALDSKGMQFCVSEQPLVTGVWLAILSEASKNRSPSIRWGDMDFELIGMARKLNISVPILNQCIGLLERVGYITKSGVEITISGWDKMQSDYARGLNRGYYEKTSKLLASRSLVSSVRGEERRGEEKRIEEDSNKQTKGNDQEPEQDGVIENASMAQEPKRKTAQFSKPSVSEIKLYGASISLPESECLKFFDYYESNGWRVGRNPMKNWHSAMANWKRVWQERGGSGAQPGSCGRPSPPKQPNYGEPGWRPSYLRG